MESAQERLKVNIDEPRYDQSTYIGRAKHFTITTSPLNLFSTAKQLDESRRIVRAYKYASPLYPLQRPVSLFLCGIYTVVIRSRIRV